MPYAKTALLFLEAAAELTNRQCELMPLLTATLGRTPFDYWILGVGRDDPKLDAIDTTIDGQWRFQFHGLELDLRHAIDGRAIRIDFGPCGISAFTPGAVGAFAGASRSPWRAFPDLKAALSGAREYDHARCVALCDDLRRHGLVDYAAPELVALVARYARLIPGRGYVLDIPSDLLPADETELVLCNNLLITEKGRVALADTLERR
jgi:hypothetical protein